MFANKSKAQAASWYDKLPPVEAFCTEEGVLNYARLYLPNIYDRLCWLMGEAEIQARIHEHFTPTERRVNAYLEMLWLWVKGYPHKVRQNGSDSSWHSNMLLDLECYCRGDIERPSIFETAFREWSRTNDLPQNVWFDDVWPIGDEPKEYYMKLREKFLCH